MSAKKYLVIVESPEKSKNIHGFLGSNYKVIATKGHVRDLPKSELGIDIENVKKLKKPIRFIWQLTLTERERQLVGIYYMP